ARRAAAPATPRRRRVPPGEARARLGDGETSEGKTESQTAARAEPGGGVDPAKNAIKKRLEKPLRLHEQRLDRVAEVLKASGARRVVDLGCGSGKLLKRLMAERQFQKILGIDVGIQDLEAAGRGLRPDRVSGPGRGRL